MMTQQTVLIIGAGIAGLMAANKLVENGWRVQVVDKGRGVGGRMATRRIATADGTARIDHGAQYFTHYDPQLQPYLNKWLDAGIIRQWSTGFYTSDGIPHFNETPRYVGAAGMTALPKYLAQGIDVQTGVEIKSLRWEGEFVAIAADGADFSAETVILTPPVPQSLALLKNSNISLPTKTRSALEQIEYDPCFAVLAVLATPSQVPSPGGVWPVFPEPISWIADNQQKGISALPSVTIHGGPKFSRDHFNADPDHIANKLIEAAQEMIGAEVIAHQLRRWRYSIPVQMFPARFALVANPAPLIFTGDAFAGPRIEGAAMSGLAAAEKLLAMKT
jgi:predicted NAD/FAD-dependent oxidoreductase